MNSMDEAEPRMTADYKLYLWNIVPTKVSRFF